MIGSTKPKQANCIICNESFTRYTSTVRVCSPKCAFELIDQKKAKKERKTLKLRKEKLKTKRDWLREAQTAFNRYIKARDRVYYLTQHKAPECVSCGTTNQDIQYAAGHYKTRGSHPELSFDEENVHLQCNNNCNKHLSGNINGTKDTRGYKEGMLIRYGVEKGKAILTRLDGENETPEWMSDIEQIKLKKKEYNRKARELERKIEGLM